MRPGISAFADNIEGLQGALAPLIQFAKEVLQGKEQYWSLYPIFLGATAGVRELAIEQQNAVMSRIQELFNNKSFCPFLFETDYARVLSGEEEGVYGWVAANFLLGTFQEAMLGYGSANSQHTYGALDLGGGSTQITFFKQNQEIMSSMFKLLIGASKHWNLYTHSYLGFGHVSSRDRMDTQLQTQYPNSKQIRDMCLPPGSLRTLNTSGTEVELYGDENTSADNCISQIYAIFMKETNVWCNFVYRNECSFANTYQPPLPLVGNTTTVANFLGFSGFAKAFQILGMPTRATLTDMKVALEPLCLMTKKQLHHWVKANPNVSSTDIDSAGGLDNVCFFNAYVIALLNYGYGFPMNFTLMAQNEMKDLSISWALGSVIYQINSQFPWQYIRDLWWANYTQILCYICIFLLVGNILALPFAWNEVRKRKIKIYTKLFG